MRSRWIKPAAAGLAALGLLTGTGLAQPGVAERAGQAIDGVGRGLKQEVQEVGGAVRKRFEVVRTEVGRMGVHPRVFSRLHWDRSLHGSRIEVHVLRGGTVLLRGTVPDLEARRRAVELASSTVDVTAVLDELTVTEAPVLKRPAGR